VKTELSPFSIPQLSTTHFTTVQLETDLGPVVLVSVYFQYADSIVPYLNQLENILIALRREHVLFCGDVNANSTLWHSAETDDRGILLEELVLRH